MTTTTTKAATQAAVGAATTAIATGLSTWTSGLTSQTQNFLNQITSLLGLLGFSSSNTNGFTSFATVPVGRTIETGSIQCSNTDSWNTVNSGKAAGFRETFKQVTFTGPYTQKPKVLLSITYVNVDATNNKAYRYYTYATQLSTSGMKIYCRDYSPSSIASERLDWMQVDYVVMPFAPPAGN